MRERRRGRGRRVASGELGGERRSQGVRGSREWKSKRKLKREENRRNQRAIIHETSRERQMKRDMTERQREKEQESYMQLELLSSIPQFGYVIFVAQLRDAKSMHILNSIQKMLVWVNGEGNKTTIRILWLIVSFAVEQHAWVTCKQQLMIAMETNARFREAGKQSLLEFIKATLPSLKLQSLMLISWAVIIMFQHLTNTHWTSTIVAKYQSE